MEKKKISIGMLFVFTICAISMLLCQIFISSVGKNSNNNVFAGPNNIVNVAAGEGGSVNNDIVVLLNAAVQIIVDGNQIYFYKTVDSYDCITATASEGYEFTGWYIGFGTTPSDTPLDEGEQNFSSHTSTYEWNLVAKFQLSGSSQEASNTGVVENVIFSTATIAILTITLLFVVKRKKNFEI